MYYLKTLGELAVYSSADAEQPVLSNAKPLVLLALLATTPRHTARRDYLAGLLWPGSRPSAARRSLRQALFYLGKNLGEPVIEADESELRLERSRLNVDVWEFDLAMGAEEYERVLELYGGRFLQGNEDKAGPEVEHWIEAQNARIQVGLEVAYAELVANALQKDDARRAARYARAYVELNPLNEQAQILLVRALRAAGDEVAALAAYQSYRTLLERELEGEQPGEDLQEAIERVRDSVRELPTYVPIDVGRALGEAAATAKPAAAEPVAQSRRRLVVIGVSAAAALIILLIGARMFLLSNRVALNPLAGSAGRFYVTVGESENARLAQAVLGGDAVEVEETDLSAGELPAPDPRLVALMQQAPDGWNLAVRDVSSGEVRILTERAGDEYPEAWSPDSRYLLYSASTLAASGRGYDYELRLHRVETGEDRSISRQQSGQRMSAAWSHDGTRIAFVADVGGRPEVFVIDFNGANPWDVSNSVASDVDPTWSPDGDLLAFISDREDSRDVYTAHPTGTGLRRVTSLEGTASDPLWVTATAIVFVLRNSRTSDLWGTELTTGQVRRLTRRGDVTAIRTGLLGEPKSWIERLEITPRVEVASPGEHLELDVVITDAEGDTLAPDGIGITWSAIDSTSDGPVAEVVEPGLVRLRAPGRARLIASARGWRADTLAVVSIPLVKHGDLEPIFSEDWTAGLDTSRWIGFGEPAPFARPNGGPDGAGAFGNNGDAHFASGAISRQTFAPESGFAIEAFGRMPFTGKVAQRFAIALYPPEPDDSTGWIGTRPLLEFQVRGRASDEPASAWVATRDARSPVPFPTRPEAWHAYTLQVTPEGIVELVIDSTLHWRSAWRIPTLSPIRAGLGYQSFETRILHGPVKVYQRPKYFLLDLSSPTDSAEESPARVLHR